MTSPRLRRWELSVQGVAMNKETVTGKFSKLARSTKLAIKVECAYGGCAIMYVPTRPWQRFHDPVCRKLDWKERHPNG